MTQRKGADDHRQFAGTQPVRVAIVTVSDSRTPETDTNRQFIEQRLTELGHIAAAYRLIKDEPDQVRAALDELAAMPDVRIILFNGGTGISPRDTTFDVISRMLEKTLPGFGELFRMLSYPEVGAAAMLSRATAGVYKKTFVASVPGSPNAVQVALEKLILPEINHLAWEVVRK
ncbi:MAG: MogA/MoaB family molybdenum cofactor biosynthesis protein [Anaerolineae bacterium]|nr:MogA/MoaB family molybdenum cofactor biosynthesis protein [Anaerolineae bacterium]NUQ06926.1 MogA/MoaB family molybdenum cofactor biosynthesis protein [Anaerolineae bacterium]